MFLPFLVVSFQLYSGSAPPNVGREFTQGQPSRQKNTAKKSEQRKLHGKNWNTELANKKVSRLGRWHPYLPTKPARSESQEEKTKPKRWLKTRCKKDDSYSASCGKTVPTDIRLHSPPRTWILLQRAAEYFVFGSSRKGMVPAFLKLQIASGNRFCYIY